MLEPVRLRCLLEARGSEGVPLSHLRQAIPFGKRAFSLRGSARENTSEDRPIPRGTENQTERSVRSRNAVGRCRMISRRTFFATLGAGTAAVTAVVITPKHRETASAGIVWGGGDERGEEPAARLVELRKNLIFNLTRAMLNDTRGEIFTNVVLVPFLIHAKSIAPYANDARLATIVTIRAARSFGWDSVADQLCSDIRLGVA